VRDLRAKVLDFVVQVANDVLEEDDELVALGQLLSQPRHECAVFQTSTRHSATHCERRTLRNVDGRCLIPSG
jgi:hypothetical protein